MKQLTGKEKCELLVAKETILSKESSNGKIFAIKFSDGPAGLRMPTDKYPLGKPQLCLPSINTIANSFNEEIAFAIGKCLASQCIEENVDVILAPGMNIKRTPLCGRNFEYFSEDPYLTGIQATQFVNGVQSLGIGACIKHFCCNNREFDRLFQSSEVDYRTLREIYLKGFEMVIKNANPYSLMCSYNAVNGINVAENKYILDDILRKKFGYDGLVISDWGAVKDRVNALKATLDIEFPKNPHNIEKLYQAYNDKIITDNDLDLSIARIEKTCNRIIENKSKRIALNDKQIKDICINTISEGAILLKNEDNILPLKEKNIALLGGLVYEPSYCGGGSATIYLKEKIKSLDYELKKQLPNANINYSMMFEYCSCTEKIANVQLSNLKGGYQIAYESDVAVIVVGTNRIIETESYDRNTLKLDDSIEFVINEVAKRNKNVVVVVEASCVIDMSNWINNVKGVLYANLAGSYVNEALALLLSGKQNPSGRLSETFPLSINDNPVILSHGNGYVDNYFEKNLVGYRYYLTNNIPVLYPFGYGLSYSTFEYKNIYFNVNNKYDCSIELDIHNISSFDGKDVLQVYISQIDSPVLKPTRELKRFKKIAISAFNKEHVQINLDKDCFEYFNVCIDDFDVLEGHYEIILTSDNVQEIAKFKLKI